MDLLVFNMSNVVDWQQGVVNRNFFVLRELLQREDVENVMLVDFLAIQPVKKVFGKQRTWDYTKWYRQQKGEKIGSVHKLIKMNAKEIFDINKDVWLFAGLGYLSSSSKALDLVQLALGKAQLNSDEIILWNYNAFLPQAQELPAKATIFDTVDNWSDHASYQKEAALLRSNYDLIDKEADLIFTVSKGLLDLYSSQDVHWVPNGVDINLFEASELGAKQDAKKSIGYIGTIQERVDFELIASLCEKHSSKELHFYGPIWKGVQQEVESLQSQYDNITFHGRVPYKQLPEILATIDVAIIPHKLDAFLASTNPMKMYDYLAAGKPIVTTPGAGTDVFSDIMYIADNHDEFSRAIDTAIQENSQEKVEERQNRVKMHTWKRRVDEMFTFINQVD